MDELPDDILLCLACLALQEYAEDVTLQLTCRQMAVMTHATVCKVCTWNELLTHSAACRWVEKSLARWEATGFQGFSIARRGLLRTMLQDVLACIYAARAGHLNCLRYAFEQGCPWDGKTGCNAAENGHLNCLPFAFAHGCHEPGYLWNFHPCTSMPPRFNAWPTFASCTSMPNQNNLATHAQVHANGSTCIGLHPSVTSGQTTSGRARVPDSGTLAWYYATHTSSYP
eukprot:scaffold1709_cov158-Ochromonas_danica.AAC.3